MSEFRFKRDLKNLVLLEFQQIKIELSRKKKGECVERISLREDTVSVSEMIDHYIIRLLVIIQA